MRKRRAGYDPNTGQFDPPATMYFALVFMEMELEDDLKYKDGEEYETAEWINERLEMGDSRNVEREALEEIEERTGHSIQTEGHNSFDDLVCKTSIKSVDALKKFFDDMRYYGGGGEVIYYVGHNGYFAARDFFLEVRGEGTFNISYDAVPGGEPIYDLIPDF